MQHVKFDPNGQPLKVQIDYFGPLTASYVYTLWEKNSNAKADERSGNNQNSQDDLYDLLSPVNENDGRIVEVFSTLANPTETQQNEIVAIKILQGDAVLHSDENPGGFSAGGASYTFGQQCPVPPGQVTLSDPFLKLHT